MATVEVPNLDEQVRWASSGVREDRDSGAVLQEVAAKDLSSGGGVLVLDGVVWASAYDDGTLLRRTPP